MENSGNNLYITGKAGTGKSTLLQYFKQNTKKSLAILAPTGVAAVNVGGVTIHSFFKFPPRLITQNEVRVLRKKTEVLRSLGAIVIDEISMVRADLLDGIDLSLRLNRNSTKPFGGVQVIMFGDLFQLPPVVDNTELHRYFEDYYDSPYFFSSRTLQNTNLHKVELTKIFRQTDPEFIRMLNDLRNGNIKEADIKKLNSRCGVGHVGGEFTITLTARNDQAAIINERRLASLQTKEYSYLAEIYGRFEDSAYPTDYELRLKEGAQVMMIRNDPNKRWVNGSLGTVSKLSSDSVQVEIEGYGCIVEKTTWEKIDYEYSRDEKKIEAVVTGSFKQFPIKLAWAITIHKSQGKTFDNVIIDVGGGAFAHGQVYVALSRCRTFEGISLLNPIKMSDIIVDSKVLRFFNN